MGRPAGSLLCGLASVFVGAESFLVYSAGQLSTTFAAPLYLNALPFIYEWLLRGKWRALLKGSVLAVAAAAAHHATLLFGAFLFALPVLALAFLERREESSASTSRVITRTAGVVALVGAAIGAVLLPFWIALYNYPVTQTPIPHPSRANYLLSPQWGLNYFVIPYGALILALPYIAWRGFSVRPFAAIAVWLLARVPIGAGGYDAGGEHAPGPRLRSSDHGALQLLGDSAGFALHRAVGGGVD